MKDIFLNLRFYILKYLHDKKEYVTHIRNLNPALNHEIVLTKVYSANKLNHQS